MKNKFYINILSAFTLLLAVSCATPKDGGQINVDKIDGVQNVVVKGYDVVSYFNKPVKGQDIPLRGKKEFSYKWEGVNWFFASEANLKEFRKNPDKYAPQYGGYCAYGVSVPEQKIDIEPKAWTVFKGKLYLNYTQRTQDIWLENKEDHIEAADENWPEVKKQ